MIDNLLYPDWSHLAAAHWLYQSHDHKTTIKHVGLIPMIIKRPQISLTPAKCFSCTCHVKVPFIVI